MVHIDTRSDKPLYEQIIEEIKNKVLMGYLTSGDCIPSVRKLALELSITPGTVAKAYQELERQGIIETIRGKGTFVADTSKIRVDDKRIEYIQNMIRGQLMDLKFMGMSKEEVLDLVGELYDLLR